MNNTAYFPLSLVNTINESTTNIQEADLGSLAATCRISVDFFSSPYLNVLVLVVKFYICNIYKRTEFPLGLSMLTMRHCLSILLPKVHWLWHSLVPLFFLNYINHIIVGYL